MEMFRRMLGKTNEVAQDDDISPSVQPTPDKTEVEDKVAIESTPDPLLLSLEGATQKISPDEIITDSNNHLTFGQVTDVGMVRNNNQDAAASFFFTNRSVTETPDFGFFVVADGMGGHLHGEKASAIAVKVVTTEVLNRIYLPLVTGDHNDDLPPFTETLVEAVQKANNEVIKQVTDGGTTTTVVITVGSLAYIAHVGDSRAYLITEGNIEQITRDHSLVQRLIELDQLTPEEAEDHPKKNILYRALGQNETLEVDISTQRLASNSSILICSDGLWGLVQDKAMLDIIVANPEPQEACSKLVAQANANGGIDNITAVILNVN
jgi:PPM family protein phosphatase